MAGIQEILILLVIILGIIFIPRIMAGGKVKKNVKKTFHLSGRMRLSIILSIVTPLATALVFEPWKHNLTAFILTGILPVTAGWAIFWVMSGFKKSGSNQRGGH